MLSGFSRSGIQSKVLALTIFCLGAPSAFAVHDDGAIEMDGDVVSSVFDDWEDVYTDCGTSGPCPPVTTGASRQSFQSDSGLPDPTAFTGSKDADPVNSTVGDASWQCTEGQVQGKSDIEYAYGAVYDELGEKILYAGMDRRTFNGTSYMGIWLFQQPVGCVSTGGTTPFTGHKTDGDLLLIINYTNGGAVNSVNVYRWTDPDFVLENGDECLGGARGPIGSECVNVDQLYFSSVDCENPTISDPPINDSLCGITNGATPISPTWRPDSPLGDNAFFEAGINLTDFSLTDAVSGSECYSSIMIETRSSAELTADLKDFVFLDLATCGTVTIEKLTNVDTADSFPFTIDQPTGAQGTTGFNLQGSGDGPNGGGAITLDAVESGTYVFTEGALPSDDWSLDDITCSSGQGATDLVAGTLELTVNTEDDIVCTFTNNLAPPPGTLLISKECVTTSANSGSWTFDITGPEGSVAGSTCPTGEVTIACGEPSVSCTDLPPGVYTVNERNPLDLPWVLTDVTCSGGISTTCDIANTPDASVELGDQEGVNDAVSVKFTNTENAEIEICKETIPEGVGGDFPFTSNWAHASNFDLAHGECEGPNAVTPDGTTYTFTEGDVANYTLGGATCTGVADWRFNAENSTLSVTPAPGESASCTFTNTEDPGSITVCKETIPSGSNQEFFFEVSATNGSPGLPVSATLIDSTNDPDQCSQPVPVIVGTGYAITESAVEGWDLTSATCDDGSSVDNIGISAGENVTCTYVNTQRGSITVVKNAIGADGVFNFTASYGNFSIDTAVSDENVASNLAPGAYSVTEDLPNVGWDFSGVTCDDDDSANDPTALELDAGEDITCTFTNVKLNPAISITKSPGVQTISPGETAMWTIEVTNAGNQDLENVMVTDALAPDCDADIGDLAMGDSTSYDCSLDNIQVAFTNVAEVTGDPVDGGDPVEDSDDARVNIYVPPANVPVDGNWALLLLILSILGVAWYRRPLRD